MDPSWSAFANFFAALGPRPDGYVLSRHALDRVYNASNCFWELRQDQLARVRESRRLHLEPLTLKDGTTKRCTACRVEKKLEEFYRDDRTKKGKQSHCKRCICESSRAASLADPIKAMLKRAQSRARKKGFEFSLVAEDLMPLPTRCPIFGIELTRGNGQQDPSAFSLDRIDNSKGYVSGNVIVMSYLANRLKNDGTAEHHEKIAAWMRVMESGRLRSAA